MATSNEKRVQAQVIKSALIDKSDSGRRAKAINNGRKYTNFEEIYKECNCPKMIILISGRGSGKSWSTADFLEKDFRENGHKFILMSRDIIKTRQKRLWFHQSNITLRESSFYIKIDGKTEHMGYNWNLHQYADYKSSNAHNDVYNIVFEEFVELEYTSYWEDEYMMFLNIVNTVLARASEDVNWGRIIFLGNNEVGWQNNPYLQALSPTTNYLAIPESHPVELYNSQIANVVFYRAPMGYVDESQLHWSAFLPSNSLLMDGSTALNKDMLEVFLAQTHATFRGTGKKHRIVSSFADITIEECELLRRQNAPNFLLVYLTTDRKIEPIRIYKEKQAASLYSRLRDSSLRLIYKDQESFGDFQRMFNDFDFSQYYLTQTEEALFLNDKVDFNNFTDKEAEKLIFGMVLNGKTNIRDMTQMYHIDERIYRRYGL